MPHFSVIIPTYNRCNMLLEAVQSVLQQTYTNYELIVVDDGSTDGTWEQLQQQYSNLRLFRQTNTGPGAARNLGVQHADGDYFAFLDSDDLWFPWTLETYARALRIDGQASHLIGRAVEDPAIGVATRSVQRCKNSFLYLNDFLSSSGEQMVWASCLAVVHSSVFSPENRFDELMRCYEDQDFALRIGCQRNFVIVREPITVRLRCAQDSLSRSQTDERFIGLMAIVGREEDGLYPGGLSRKRDRRRYITLNVRPLSIKLLKEGGRKKAWRLYCRAFKWNLFERRWKYIFGFPVLAAVHAIVRPRLNENRT